jgi:hypothetical protein
MSTNAGSIVKVEGTDVSLVVELDEDAECFVFLELKFVRFC